MAREREKNSIIACNHQAASSFFHSLLPSLAFPCLLPQPAYRIEPYNCLMNCARTRNWLACSPLSGQPTANLAVRPFECQLPIEWSSGNIPVVVVALWTECFVFRANLFDLTDAPPTDRPTRLLGRQFVCSSIERHTHSARVNCDIRAKKCANTGTQLIVD